MTKFKDVNAAPDRLRVLNNSTGELQNQLRTSVQAWGILRLPVVNDRTGRVLDGRLLIQVLRALGHEECEMHFISIDPKDEEVVRCVLNNHANDWNWEAVGALLKNCEPKMTGFHSMDYLPILAANWAPAKVKDDAQFEMEL